MDLEELLVNAGDRGRRVIIVENIGEGKTVKTAVSLAKTVIQNGELAELTNDLFGRPVETAVIHPKLFKEALAGDREVLSEIKLTDLILFSGYTPGGFPSLMPVLESISAMDDFRKKMPHIPPSNHAFVLPSQKEDGPLQRVWKQILRDIFGKGEDFFKYVIHGPFIGSGDSLVSVLKADASSLKHRVGSLKDARFMDTLSKQFNLGCHQTAMEKTFLCVNDKLKERDGRFAIIGHDRENAGSLDFNKYYAVFIDNGWDKQEGRLGKGVNSLMKISRALEGQGINIPIFYQTAHDLDRISEEEKARVAAFANTHLISKNLAPKVSRSKEEATKELEASRILGESLELRPYVVEAVPIGGKGFVKIEDKFLTFSKAAVMPENANNQDPLNHRMYVLAHLHSYMQNQVENPTLQLTGSRLREFKEIQESINQHAKSKTLPSRLNALQQAYEQVVAEHSRLPVQTIIHNDAKWDNWFAGGFILGDFGSMCPGRESKDIASALLNPKHRFKKTRNKAYVDAAVQTYIDQRRTIDPEFNQTPEQMRREVYGMLVTESLRRAYYKAAHDLDLTKSLILVAETYAPLAS
ncbi:MAG: hypothetical protein Q8Q31_05280 [Nanoarchaeota archaeon]|nr:hypothetical protein [Nanoarchaeota archaeon]